MYGLVCSQPFDEMGTVVAMASGSTTVFAKRLRRLRKAAKLNRETAAERGGISANFWGEVERGESEPGLESIFRMAKGLQLPAAALLVDKEEDPNLLKKTHQLVEKATPDQLTLLHRIAKAIIG
jgi:transcriptional regulator with XRE-family HTH domain